MSRFNPLLARWLPRSLFGRNLLLIIGLIILAEIALGFVMRQEIQLPRMSNAQEYAYQQAITTRALLAGMDKIGRARWQSLHPAPQFSASKQEFSLPYRLAPAYIHALQQRLGSNFSLHWQSEAPAKGSTQNFAQGQPRLHLQIHLDGERYWMPLDTSALQTKLTPLILMVAIGAGGLALCGAGWIQYRLNAPLRQLATAAQALGKGQQQDFTAPKSTLPLPLEIAQLTSALQEMAEDLQAAERERALMLAGVSHDLRTPLTKLRLASEILQSSALPQEDVELLQGMARNINAADAVIAQFIAFARMGSDELECTVDVVVLLRELVQEWPQVKLVLEHEKLNLRCRPIALRRAIQNLVDNALRYATPHQAGDIELSLSMTDTQMSDTHMSDTHMLCITLADRGPGIPAEQRLRVRQPFTRLEHARTDAQHSTGTGLGLAIVERIARLHHGSLQLQERDGGGLLVSLLLPL